MSKELKKDHVVRRILAWYRRNGRALPWRQTHDPYHILVSEVMLQQTQVDRVIPKYHAFLTQFPTVMALASAPRAAVITAWAGLGYNRRALYLQKAAQKVLRDRDGIFPETIEELRELPGVGDYTARAILSFGFQKPVAMMDTNHRRFYQRVFFGLNTKSDQALLAAAEQIFPKGRSYDWNQALMDFGSLICATRKPLCEECPVKNWCKSYPMRPRVIGKNKKIKTRAVRFLDTDRYIRGRIIDALRNSSTLSKKKIHVLFPDKTCERIDAVLGGLERDELLVKKREIYTLPDVT